MPFLIYDAYGLEQYTPHVEITPTTIVRYGDTFTIHAWLDSYEKPDDLRYYIEVIDENGRRVDSTLWFAREDFIYDLDTAHPVYNITKGGTYLVKVERANGIERTGIIDTTIIFEIVKPKINLEPVTPLDLWNKHENIFDGTVINAIGQKSIPITYQYQIKINKYFKPDNVKPSLISAISNTTTWFDVGDSALFYSYKKDGIFWISPYSVKTTKLCDARDFIEISPVLPNEKPPISSPAGIDDYVDICVPSYFPEDPDLVKIVVDDKSNNSNVLATPLKQFKSGIVAENVKCKEGLKMIIKLSNNSPACVKPESIPKLIEREWAENMKIPEITEIREQENKIITSEDNDKLIDIKKGESFVVKLDSSYEWRIDINNKTVVDSDYSDIRYSGSQGVYIAHNSGQAILTGMGDPLCRLSAPQCASPSILFQLNINVN